MNLTLLRILRNACLIITYKVVLRLPQKKKKKRKKKKEKKRRYFSKHYIYNVALQVQLNHVTLSSQTKIIIKIEKF